MATEWRVHVVCACADGRYMVDRERGGLMMWWINHASVVLQYKRGLLTEKRNKHNPTLEQLHLEKRAFYRMKVAQDNVLREAWQEKQISNRDVHCTLVDFQKDQQEEETRDLGSTRKCFIASTTN